MLRVVSTRRTVLSLGIVCGLAAACSSSGSSSGGDTQPGTTDADGIVVTSEAIDTTTTEPAATDLPTTTVGDPDAASTTAAPTTSEAPTTVAPTFPDAIPVIIDSDANNELDDQHALAYTLFRPDLFELIAITTNATRNGGPVAAHTAEAGRIVALADRTGSVPIATGANASFDEIRPRLADDDHDGAAAVDAIIAAARAEPDLVVVPIGKLTNVALAVAKAPDIADGLRVLWLGANYPLGGGEYNLDNDPGAVSYLLGTGVDAGLDFEIAVVRPGDPTGTAAIQLTLAEAAERLPDLGPVIDPPIIGRTGSAYDDFGDYAAGLFAAAEGFGDPPTRSLFDLGAVAIVAEPAWATPVVFPAPDYVDDAFVDRPERTETIVVWERFDRDAIIEDFFATLAAAG